MCIFSWFLFNISAGSKNSTFLLDIVKALKQEKVPHYQLKLWKITHYYYFEEDIIWQYYSTEVTNLLGLPGQIHDMLPWQDLMPEVWTLILPNAVQFGGWCGKNEISRLQKVQKCIANSINVSRNNITFKIYSHFPGVKLKKISGRAHKPSLPANRLCQSQIYRQIVN